MFVIDTRWGFYSNSTHLNGTEFRQVWNIFNLYNLEHFLTLSCLLFYSFTIIIHPYPASTLNLRRNMILSQSFTWWWETTTLFQLSQSSYTYYSATLVNKSWPIVQHLTCFNLWLFGILVYPSSVPMAQLEPFHISSTELLLSHSNKLFVSQFTLLTAVEHVV